MEKPGTYKTSRPASAPPWKAICWLKGTLKRSKPDENGRRDLFLLLQDGTMIKVRDIGRADNTVIQFLTRQSELFSQPLSWTCYPATNRSGDLELTLIGWDEADHPKLNQFELCGGFTGFEAGKMRLFIGRQNTQGYHFVDVLAKIEQFEPKELLEVTGRFEAGKLIAESVKKVAKTGQKSKRVKGEAGKPHPVKVSEVNAEKPKRKEDVKKSA